MPLERASLVDQVVIVDHSRDATAEIARSLGAEVHDPYGGRPSPPDEYPLPSVPAWLAGWARLDGCRAASAVQAAAPGQALRRWTRRRGRADIVAYAVHAGHVDALLPEAASKGRRGEGNDQQASRPLRAASRSRPKALVSCGPRRRLPVAASRRNPAARLHGAVRHESGLWIDEVCQGLETLSCGARNADALWRWLRCPGGISPALIGIRGRDTCPGASCQATSGGLR